MNPNVNNLNINVCGEEVSIKLIEDNISKNTIQIAGRKYSIEYGNNKTIPLIKQAVQEIFDQSIENMEEFQSKLCGRVNINLLNHAREISELFPQINDPGQIVDVKNLNQTLSKEKVNDYLRKLESCPYFSGVVKVQFSDGTSSVAIAKGSLPDQQFDENTMFNIMSVGKLFTAIGIMQLFEQGKLDLDAPINNYLTREQLELKGGEIDPRYIEDMGFQNDETRNQFFIDIEASPITVRQLLTHTAGILGGREGYRFDNNEIGKYNYSNYGFQLLARIIESQTGKPFVDYIQENIFTNPNPMDREIIMPGALLHSNDYPPQEPIPTNVYKQELLPVDEPIRVPKPDGNGCWWMKANDLINFSKAFMEGKYVSPESQEAMLSPVVSKTPDGFLQQGLGFVLSPGKNNEPSAFIHQGSFGGRSAFVSTIYDKGANISIAALCNCDSGSNFFADLVRMARGEEIATPLSYLEKEGKVTREAIDWLLMQDPADEKSIVSYLVEINQVPYHLLKVIAKELEPTKPDIAKILRSV